MALIKCPECNKEVSDKATVCIHCGFPFEQNPLPDSFKNLYYGVKIINEQCIFGKSRTYLSRMWVENGLKTGNKDLKILVTGISKDRAELVLKYITSRGGEAEIFEDTDCTQENKKLTLMIDTTINPNAPLMCPICGSTSITTGERGFSFFTGFLGSNKTTNRCAKCGHSWQP